MCVQTLSYLVLNPVIKFCHSINLGITYWLTTSAGPAGWWLQWLRLPGLDWFAPVLSLLFGAKEEQ
jgi:hypothetical protein